MEEWYCGGDGDDDDLLSCGGVLLHGGDAHDSHGGSACGVYDDAHASHHHPFSYFFSSHVS